MPSRRPRPSAAPPDAGAAPGASANAGAGADAGLRGLGPVSRGWLAGLGLHSGADLARADAVAVYLQLKARVPGVSLNLLWALVGAQTGQPWQTVARERRTDLLLELELRQGPSGPAPRARRG